MRPTVPPKVRSGIGSSLRSCANLPIAVASSAFSARDAVLVGLGDGLRGRARQRLLDREPVLVVEDRDDTRGPRRQLVGDPFHARLHLRSANLPISAADGAADRDRGQERRREEANDQADTGAPPEALPAQVVAVLDDGDRTIGIVGDQDRSLDLDLLALDGRMSASKSRVATSMP